MTEPTPSAARQEAIDTVKHIHSLITASQVDFDRIEELVEERAAWLEENPGRFLHTNDPRDGGRWYLANPDEAEELDELRLQAGEFKSQEDALEQIRELPLSVLVRSTWQEPGQTLTQAEYRITLSAGGPSCWLQGDVDSDGTIGNTVRVLYSDWDEAGELFNTTDEQRSALLDFVRYFFE